MAEDLEVTGTKADETDSTEAVATPVETEKVDDGVSPEEILAPETEGVDTSVTSVGVPLSETPREPNPVMQSLNALRQSANSTAGKFTPRLSAYWKQWPRTFLVWFLVLLCLSLLVWRFLPGDVTVGSYTPAQGLFIPITVFGGPLIIAVFIATHGGLEWYSNTIAVKGIGLRLIDYFFKFTAWVGNLLPFPQNRRTEIFPSHSGIADLPFPGLGFQGFLDRYVPSENTSAERVLETVSRYQLQNLGKIAINFFLVYFLVKLPAIVLWEALSLTLEWSIYKLGFSLARVPFPALTIYHWELFLIENIAVAFVIFFQEVRLDTAKTSHLDEVLTRNKVAETEV